MENRTELETTEEKISLKQPFRRLRLTNTRYLRYTLHTTAYFTLLIAFPLVLGGKLANLRNYKR